MVPLRSLSNLLVLQTITPALQIPFLILQIFVRNSETLYARTLIRNLYFTVCYLADKLRDF
jgi:hypothetical protein